MDHADLQTRFRRHVQRARRDTLVYALSALVVSLFAIPALGLLLYMATFRLFGVVIPTIGFIVCFVLAFLGFGYWQYRRAPSGRSMGDSPIWAEYLPYGTWRFRVASPVAGCSTIVFSLLTVPSLVFHLVGGLLESRHYFQAPDAEEIALQLMTAPDGISQEAVEAALRQDERATEAALRLLFHTGFVRVRQTSDGLKLRHTLEWESFLEASG